MRCRIHLEPRDSPFSSIESSVFRDIEQSRLSTLGRSELEQENLIMEKEAEILGKARTELQELRNRNEILEQNRRILEKKEEKHETKQKLYKEEIKLLKSKVALLENGVKENRSKENRSKENGVKENVPMNSNQPPASQKWKDNFIEVFLDLISKLEQRDNLMVIPDKGVPTKKKIKWGWRYLKSLLSRSRSNPRSKSPSPSPNSHSFSP